MECIKLLGVGQNILQRIDKRMGDGLLSIAQERTVSSFNQYLDEKQNQRATKRAKISENICAEAVRFENMSQVQFVTCIMRSFLTDSLR